MTCRLLLSPKAQADLEQIWEHTTERWGMEQAEVYTRVLWQHLNGIATHPGLGTSCPIIRPGYRRFKSGTHVIFYQQAGDDVSIIRILHERMDFERHI
ncbi:MAG: plasmid stabilization protein ParE [Acidocella sp. 35-58-6]|nr:MAG: plasmid stabilization protein ParE [Acidocella sp. 35-58-6]